MNVSNLRIFILIRQDDFIQQLFQSLAVTSHHRHHRNTNHSTQLFVVELGSRLLQLIVHIQSHDHLGVKVDKLRSKVEVTLKV